jgi:four helix bundle protein
MKPQDLRSRLAAFATAVEAFSRPLLDKVESRDSALQLRRASTGAASNHRAAGRGRSHAEFTAKLSVALEEADESQFWLEHLAACGLAPDQDLKKLIPEAEELVAILTASVRTARGRQK